MNPVLMEMNAQARMAEMRRASAMRVGRGQGHAGDTPLESQAPMATAWTRRPAAARRTIGWFLVRVGLRLALSRPFAASAR